MAIARLKSNSSIDFWIDYVNSDTFGASRLSSISAETVIPARVGTVIIPASLSIEITFLGDVQD